MSLIGSTCVDRCDQHEIGYIEHRKLGPNTHFTDACNFLDVVRFFYADCKAKVQNGHNNREEIPIEGKAAGERSDENESHA